MKRILRKTGIMVRTSLASCNAYRSAVWFGAFFFAFILFMFFQLWGKVSGTDGALGPYTVQQLVWYFMIAELIAMTRSDVFIRFSDEIRSGGVAYRLTRPGSVTLLLLAEGWGQVIFRLITYVPVGVAMGFLLAGAPVWVRLRWLPVMILSVVLGMLLMQILDAVTGLLAFWTEDTSAFFWIIQKLVFMLGVFLPLEFLPEGIRQVAVWLPFPYLVYAPARLFSFFNTGDAVRMIGIQLLWLGALLLLMLGLFRKGVKAVHVQGG